MLWYWGGWWLDAISVDRFSIEWFHDYCIGYIWSVLVFVGLKLHQLYWNYTSSLVSSINLNTDSEIAFNIYDQLHEFTWTLIPATILAWVGLHSLDMLYSTSCIWDQRYSSGIVVKVLAHQWYWTYEYSSYTRTNSIRYDSYIKPLPSLGLGEYRLLESDYRGIVPIALETGLVVTSSDLLHSFSIPTISVKIDANPARLNAIMIMIVIPGLYYGQCSELCGVNHSFMPILLEATSLSSFELWMLLAIFSD